MFSLTQKLSSMAAKPNMMLNPLKNATAVQGKTHTHYKASSYPHMSYRSVPKDVWWWRPRPQTINSRRPHQGDGPNHLDQLRSPRW